MKYAVYILGGWLIASSALISCEHTQSNERIAKESNREKFSTDAERDAQLVVDLTSSNYAEIEMAKTAKKRSENKEIRDLAGMLEADYTTLVHQLKEYAAKKNITLPGAASGEAVQNAQDMAEKNQPADFDKKWCAELLDKHEQTISRMESVAKEATDPDLRAWLNNTLPRIRMHRDKLKECNDSIR